MIVLAAVVIALAAILRRRLAVVRVCGASMSPTLRDASRVLIARRRRPHRGEIVVFRTSDPVAPGDPALRIKRVAAVGGDPVPAWMAVAAAGSGRVPAGCLVVRGDGVRSADSRHFGYVAEHDVIGGVLLPRRCSG
jgi:signal peptidase I